MKPGTLLAIVLTTVAATSLPTRAQEPVPPPAPAVDPVPPADLTQWLGPVALYPDPLLAQVLAAATQPADIVLADRYLSTGGDPAQLDAQPWDPSVKAVARYPEVLKLMSDYLGWTTELGQAYLYQQPEVMEAIQYLRAQAVDLGNLDSTPEENVLTDDGAIEILPTEPDVIYVPDYEPDVVYTQQPFGTPCISFGLACPMGSWMDRDFDWHHRRCLTWENRSARPADWWSNRHPAPPAPPLAPGGHPQAPIASPRTQTTRFVVWQVPPVRVVTTDDLAGRGWEPRQVHMAHSSDHPGRSATGGSSLFIVPYHGMGAGAHAPRAFAGIQAYSSGTPVQTDVISVGHHGRGQHFGPESAHDTERFSHRGHESRGSGSASATHSQAPAPSHSDNSGHSGGASHSDAPSHSSGGTHSGGSSGKH